MSHSLRLPAVGRAVLDLVLPATCAGCGAPGAACCAGCAAVWTSVLPVARSALGPRPPAYALARYRGVARRLVLAHKERGRRDLAAPLGAALAAALPYLPGARPDTAGVWWLVPAPSRRSAARMRGGSHVRALAVAAARRLPAARVAAGLRLAPGVRDAVGLDHRQRAANLAGRVRLIPTRLPPPGTPVVLLDDVLTTGATVTACRQALATGGLTVTAVLTLTVAG
ncbi:Predicted amidophosphoribosyltransferases [Amycolatopsis arida]|uniref:Predicted amidophosphoribosyltransferases n=1 Tax=Amycolatopsis arida TaxID=587909 RepID=A0A1I5PJS5_9PSEU|nr:ComF family protein [Amycolatopsis arida]TDX98518.1 putative amidophosphoribosyltransferase [Amycolatopsis arida]SFP34050.1 Predicted amidophosphoribosyltransferases [Amycolatopsis arida]